MNLADYDNCPHCGTSDWYCPACTAATACPDHCDACGTGGWLPVQWLGERALYRCSAGHQWFCSWDRSFAP